MTERKQKPLYEPPRGVDLSSQSVNGQDKPLGVCSDGFYPYSGCDTGTDVAGGSCEGGTAPDTGVQCRPWGSTADSDCTGGGYQ